MQELCQVTDWHDPCISKIRAKLPTGTILALARSVPTGRTAGLMSWLTVRQAMMSWLTVRQAMMSWLTVRQAMMSWLTISPAADISGIYYEYIRDISRIYYEYTVPAEASPTADHRGQGRGEEPRIRPGFQPRYTLDGPLGPERYQRGGARLSRKGEDREGQWGEEILKNTSTEITFLKLA